MKKRILSLALVLTLTLAFVPSIVPSALANVSLYNIDSLPAAMAVALADPGTNYKYDMTTAESYGEITIPKNLYVRIDTGASLSITGNLKAEGEIGVGGSLIVTGNLDIDSHSAVGWLQADNCVLDVGGSVNVSENASLTIVNSRVNIRNDFNYLGKNGIDVYKSTIEVGGNLTGRLFSGGYTQAGNTRTLIVRGNLEVISCIITEWRDGNPIRSANGYSLRDGDSIEVGGDMTISEGALLSISSTLNSGLHTVNIKGDLIMEGLYLRNNGNLNVGGSAIVKENVDFYIDSNINIKNNLTVDGKLTVDKGILSVGGDLILGDKSEVIKENNGEIRVAGKTIGETTKPTPNLDTASEWARDGITRAVSKGFVPDDLQGNYTNVITRAEFCRMAVKWVEYKTGKTIDAVLSEKGVSRNTNAFTDTNDQDILAAFALGITSGIGNNQFDPNGQFSREQAAAMIINVCKVIGINMSIIPPSGFADMGSVSSWSVDGVNFCFANGIMSGTGNNQFSPKATYTREQSILTFGNIK